MVLGYEACDIDDIRATTRAGAGGAARRRPAAPYPPAAGAEGDTFIPFDGGAQEGERLPDRLSGLLPEKQRRFVLLSGDEVVWLVGRRIDDRLTDGECFAYRKEII